MTNTTVTIDLDKIVDRVCAESAWRAAHAPEVFQLTADNRRLIALFAETGVNDLRARMSGYVDFWNWNPNIESGNLTITLKWLDPDGIVEPALKSAITEALAQYALASFYGKDVSYHHTSWLKHRAQVMLILARLFEAKNPE